ncbi:MAG: hypothetical protein KDA45_11720, partial [Planctomycetales bacterium]|nr:hypothetical protein [Planctomycetales bacterium]
MAKQTIIDWQGDGLLVAVGHSQGATVHLEKLCAQTMGPQLGADELSSEVSASQALSRAVDELGLRKSDVTVVVPREMVEVRTLSIPRVDPNELPDIIRFQAQRQLASMGDQWTLDYVLLPQEAGQETLTALVAAISPVALAGIEAACTAAGVQVTHMAFRPIEIARYAIHSGKLPSSGAAVVVCLAERHADLLILHNGQVVQIRGTKLPADGVQLPAILGGELRRSLMAASSQLGSLPIAGALLFASPELAQQAEAVLREAVGCAVTSVDPASLLPTKFGQAATLSQSSANRIAAVAGACHFASADPKTRLDFKEPKKRPPPKSKRPTYLLAAAAAALLLLAGISWWVSANRALDEALALQKTEIANKQDLKKVSEERIAELREIE